MKILILSPLFPPDTAPSAQYAKELALHLPNQEVTVLLYGHLPEKTSQVELISIDKRKSVFARTIQYTRTLVKIVNSKDAVIVQNGPSVELPALLSLWLKKTPFILIESDSSALKRTHENILQKIVYQQLQKRAVATISSNDESYPSTKPVIHPLKTKPVEELKKYESTWKTHSQKIVSLLTN